MHLITLLHQIQSYNIHLGNRVRRRRKRKLRRRRKRNAKRVGIEKRERRMIDEGKDNEIKIYNIPVRN